MKKNLKNLFGIARIGVGAAVFGVLACASTLRGAVIIDNTLDASLGPVINTVGQVFTMPAGDADIASVSLLLTGTGSGEIYVYNTSGGAPNTQLYDLGSVTASSSTINIAPVNQPSFPLSGGTAYAIVYKSGSLGWDYTTSSSQTGSGTIGGFFYTSSFTQTPGDYLQMSVSVTPVPEVPVTGAVMGFGVLAIAIGKTLRRKISA